MKRENHLIAANRQDEHGPCWTVCTCSHRVEGPTPEDTKEQFSKHRAAMRMKTRGGLRSQGEPTVFRVKPRVGSRTAAEDYRTW